LDTQLKPRHLLLLSIVSATVSGKARAEDAAETAGPARGSRHETTVGIGYASVAPFKVPVGYDAANIPLSSATFTGYSLEVTRRFHRQLEIGLIAWLTGSSADGKGSYAHGLSRFVGELRFLPWGFTTVEPWIGAELGFVLADDYATWDPTAKTGAHAVSATRLGHVEGLTAGARFRLSDWVALGARGGLLLVGFPRASVETEPGDATGNYFIRPTDYRTRLWYSAMLSAELTVMD
jgi:hypothetical protein